MSVIGTVSRRTVAAAVPAGLVRRFDPEAAGELDATFELRLPDVDSRYAIRVAGGQCTVQRGPAPDAAAHVTISAGDIARMVTGTVEWPVLLAAKRLQLGGDPFTALRFPRLFRFGA